CTASGTVCGSKLVGGLVGNNDNGTIENCTASGNVCGSKLVGGLVEYNDDRDGEPIDPDDYNPF
ncbi:MAG: hypothetical protein II902_07860, partial [Selenomonadaceae bacterium]|nr:hypothetical protein [Selenomonadaceae bacterium]